MHYTGTNWQILPDSAWFSQFIPCSTGFYQILLYSVRFSKFCQIIPDSARFWKFCQTLPVSACLPAWSSLLVCVNDLVQGGGEHPEQEDGQASPHRHLTHTTPIPALQAPWYCCFTQDSNVARRTHWAQEGYWPIHCQWLDILNLRVCHQDKTFLLKELKWKNGLFWRYSAQKAWHVYFYCFVQCKI